METSVAARERQPFQSQLPVACDLHYIYVLACGCPCDWRCLAMDGLRIDGSAPERKLGAAWELPVASHLHYNYVFSSVASSVACCVASGTAVAFEGENSHQIFDPALVMEGRDYREFYQ